jgi:hypothetical protein
VLQGSTAKLIICNMYKKCCIQIRLPSAFPRAWVPSVVCSDIPQAALKSIRLLSWLHYAFLAASSLTDCFRPASCTSAITSFRRWSWSLCLTPSAPAYGVTSMPFRQGCHRPFHRSCLTPHDCLGMSSVFNHDFCRFYNRLYCFGIS